MVHGMRQSHLAASITARAHELTSGVAADKGGQDEGLNPHELVESALAACTVITVQMYANHKGWPLTSAKVQVDIDAEGKVAHITRKIELVGDLTPEQRQRLLDIADKCPIHRLLTNKITVETHLLGLT